jgi:ribosomal protein S18 acetylase RimI-like enzyme
VPWRFSQDVEPYADAVLPLLRDDPTAHSGALTVIDTLRGGQRFSEEPMRFGWLADDGAPARGAISHTPPYEMLLAVVPDAGELVAALRGAGIDVPGVNGKVDTVEGFAAAWTAGTELQATTWLELRMFALGELEPPDPPPPGRARPATLDDLPLAMTWFDAFSDELDLPDRLPEARVRAMLGGGLLWLWEGEDGEPVALAMRTAAAEGVARVNAVYTPPGQRGRRYGGAVTVACCEDALGRHAERLVLFTDAGNPAPNKVYERIGFRPVADHRVVRFDLPKGV